MKNYKYPFDDTPSRLDRYEGITHLSIGIIIGLIFIFYLCLPCQAVTECYKDICIGQKVTVNKGLYKGHKVRILAIIKEKTPDDDKEQVRDYYKYFVGFMDGTIGYLYKDELGEIND